MDVVAIDGVAAGGDGVGRLEDGMTVFVPRTAPGDRVRIDGLRRRARYARARLREIVTPGPARVTPRCRHYTRDACGGCQLQHLDGPAQLAVKRRIVGDALRRIGRRETPDPEIVASPEAWRYRTKLTLHAADGALGLRRLDAPRGAFELDDCPIADARLMELWRALRPHRSLLPRSLAHLVLRVDRAGGRHVVAETTEAKPWNARPLAERAGCEATYWWRPQGGAARRAFGRGDAFPALVFEQANPRLAAQLRATAVDLLGDVRDAPVWDLYGGVGDTAELLAERRARVWSVDADAAAVGWGRGRWPHSPVERIAGRAEEWVARLPEPSAVIVNPPRAGLHGAVAAWLEDWGRGAPGRRLVYVSCDPATLARDVARLPAFPLERILAFDLFPQTSHVETLAAMRSARAR